MAIEVLDGGRLRVNAHYLPLLRANGLETFERVMAAPQGELKRNFPGRRTSRLELQDNNGATQAVYLKRYYADYLSIGRKCLRWLGWPNSSDEARAEWEAAHLIAALGIPTLEMVAVGQDSLSSKSVRRSFVMSLELTGAEEGHRFATRLNPRDRRQLLRKIAVLTRKLHQAGLVHKDLYVAHYMAAAAPSGPHVSLIDLQRVTRPCCLVNRWRVKDLAALVYSSLKAGANRRDVAAGFRIYRDNARLDPANRQLARKVLRRIEWLKTRTPKHDADFEQLL